MKNTFDVAAIKASLSLRDLCEKDGLVFRRSGANAVANCPFHRERSGSFTIHASDPSHAHCYGCGWNGDVIKYWADRRGMNCRDREHFREALEALSAMAGIAPLPAGKRPRPAKPVAIVAQRRPGLAAREKPRLPKMRLLRLPEKKQVARLRALSVEAVEAAERDERVGFALWPIDKRTGEPNRLSAPSWVITDPARWCAQFRRMDGAGYPLGTDGDKIKAWTKGAATWIIGAEQIGSRECVMLVEGGADMLACYHFLHLAGLEGKIAVCCLFGGMNPAPEALPNFRGKRVRIYMDNDPLRETVRANGESVWKSPGWETAARWQFVLEEAGAVVDVFSFAGLTWTDADGNAREVKDLNDLAKCEREVINDEIPHMFDFFHATGEQPAAA